MFTRKKIEELLKDLNDSAREYDRYELGLPLYDHQLEILIAIVQAWLKKNRKK